MVADSSYIAAAILEDALLLEAYDLFLAPDIALYEVIQTIWKHQVLLKRIANAKMYIDSFMNLIDSGKIQLLRPSSHIISDAFDLAVKKKTGVYDTIFIAFARNLRADLKTFDSRQARIFKN